MPILSQNHHLLSYRYHLKGFRDAEEIRCKGSIYGLFIGLAVERLTKATDGFMSTDTIESEYSRISVAEEIARALKE